MPEFSIHTEERWLHRVDYTVNAPTLKAALDKIIAGEVTYDSAEVVEGADELLNVFLSNDRRVTEKRSDALLAEHHARRAWEQGPRRIVICVEGGLVHNIVQDEQVSKLGLTFFVQDKDTDSTDPVLVSQWKPEELTTNSRTCDVNQRLAENRE